MPRFAPAAAHLADQVTAMDRNAKVYPIGPQDGFGVLRSIAFDAKTSKWLHPVLEAIRDERILGLHYEGKGRLEVEFVGDTRADRRTDYPLNTVLRVLQGTD